MDQPTLATNSVEEARAAFQQALRRFKSAADPAEKAAAGDELARTRARLIYDCGACWEELVQAAGEVKE